MQFTKLNYEDLIIFGILVVESNTAMLVLVFWVLILKSLEK